HTDSSLWGSGCQTADRSRKPFRYVRRLIDWVKCEIRFMAAGRPGPKMFSFEYAGSIIFNSFADNHLSTNVHQIEHPANRVTCSSIRLLFLSSPNPWKRI